jgi:4-hydroxybenzoate polyprenyltransferase/phosphoserine phosphatase
LSSFPLVVDLDGTLVRSDLLLESALLFIRAHPWSFLRLLLWLLQGKAYLKAQLAIAVKIEVATLPYETKVINLIHAEKAKGRTIILATASHKVYADAIAAHLGLFDQVMATEGELNLSAGKKRDRLLASYGNAGFDYAGNSKDDLLVWRVARYAYVVNPEIGVLARAKKQGNVQELIVTQQPTFNAWLKACRIHQWMKNLLVFVPLVASHQLGRTELLLEVLAFVFFCLCASSVYLLNDLLDLEDDRHHASKRRRPFAAGSLPIKSGVVVFPLLLLAAFTGSWIWLPWQFVAVLATYYALTLAYSMLLKRLMAVDAITLACLYTLRIIAGTVVFNGNLTFWLLAFSMFIFLSLALIKRYTELRAARVQGKTVKARGRGYYPGDLEMLSSLGAAAGYLSVLVLAMYIQDHNTMVLYRHPQVIWLACPLLLFWTTRVWLLAHRGQIHDDPVIFALKDRVSLSIGCLMAVVFWLAT